MSRNALWAAEEAAAATAGFTGAGWHATGVSIDSRSLAPGDLFIAIEGPNFDGHGFVGDAFAKGAAAAMVGPDYAGSDERLLRVADTMAGLEGLGRAARARARGRLAGITGSVGKTGTKEALRTILAEQSSVHASEGSLNNLWGVPLSLARMPRDASFGIFELGMNRPGEITPLVAQVRPHVVMVTNVEIVHSAFFASLSQIADAKAEIFSGLSPGGIAVLNRDDDQFERLAGTARAAGVKQVWSFGSDEAADARLTAFAEHADGVCVSGQLNGEEMRYKVGAPGRHWAINSLAVLLTAKALGADPGLAALAMAQVRPPPGRGERHRVNLHDGSFELIDESYNASPVAVRAALNVLAHGDKAARGRRIAVLGDMLELGADSGALHRGLADAVAASGVDLLFACGPEMATLFDAVPAPIRAGYGETSEQLLELVTQMVAPGDIVMVKGSLGSRMRPIVDALLALGPPVRRAADGR